MSETLETVAPEAPITTVADQLVSASVGSLVVVREGRPIGIVTKGDMTRLIADRRDPEVTVVEAVMSSPLVTIEHDATIEEAAETFVEHGIKRLPVTEGDEVVGIVTTTDLSYYLPNVTLQRSWQETMDFALLGTDETAYESSDWQFTHHAENGEVGVGDIVRFTKELSDTDVRSFAEASGDTNRLHLDDEFAQHTRFGQRIAHGTLVSGTISSALARIPGLTIYLSQDLRFLGPVDIGDTVTAVCEVVDDLGNERYRLKTAVYDGSGERVVDGEAVVLIDELPDDAGEKLKTLDSLDD